MLIRGVLVILILIGGYFFIRRLRRAPGTKLWPRGVAVLGGICGLLILIPGGMEMAVPLFIVLVPFLLKRFGAKTLFPLAENADQAHSLMSTRFLQIRVEHGTGVISGIVREGRFVGCQLQNLTLQQNLDLWRQCQADLRSLAVLEAYLDQRMGLSWRGQLQESERRQSASDRQPSNMTPAEAYEILGLAAGAKRDEIQAAYRRLIQRLHPDQGGSAYLAACLNRARDVLLG